MSVTVVFRDSGLVRDVFPLPVPGFTPSYKTTPGKLCDFCATVLSSEVLIHRIKQLWRRDFSYSCRGLCRSGTPGSCREFAHERRGKEMLQASREGCPWCARIVTCMHDCYDAQPEPRRLYSAGFSTEDGVVNFLDTNVIMTTWLCLEMIWTSHRAQMTAFILLNNIEVSITYALTTGFLDDGLPVFPLLNRWIDMASDSCFWGIRSHLRQCQRQHETTGVRAQTTVCKGIDKNVLPSRMIDVACHPCKIVDYSQAEHPKDYLTLSYTWGLNQDYVLTVSTLSAKMTALDHRRIPATITDAIVVTRKLRYRYLWVDALCILQDDPADIDAEIGKMQHIYRNGRLTISSALTRGATDHFLVRAVPFIRDSGSFHGQTLVGLEIDSAEGWILLSGVSDSSRLSTAPLDRRAWALQEHIMSDRLLIYEEDGIEMTCKHMFPQSPSASSLAMGSRLIGSYSGEEPIKVWRRILKEYSGRAVTRQEDKLVAIGALANIISKDIRSRYVAGLWESYIVQELAWVPKTGTRFDTYTAPLWSWAIHNGEIYVPEHEDRVFGGARVPNWQVRLRSMDNPFGAVMDGYIVLVGICRSVQLQLNLDGPYEENTEGYSWYMDYVDDESRFNEAHVVFVALVITAGGEVVGLMLRTEGGHDYVRIGMFKCTPRFLEGCEEKSFKIY